MCLPWTKKWKKRFRKTSLVKLVFLSSSLYVAQWFLLAFNLDAESCLECIINNFSELEQLVFVVLKWGNWPDHGFPAGPQLRVSSISATRDHLQSKVALDTLFTPPLLPTHYQLPLYQNPEPITWAVTLLLNSVSAKPRSSSP